MSTQLLPSKAASTLKSCIGVPIVRILRQLYKPDYDVLPAQCRDQESDGVTEITLANGRTLHFLPDTNGMSVRIGTGTMPELGDSYLLKDVTGNDFWQQRTQRSISRVVLLKSLYSTEENPGEFAVEIVLKGSRQFVIEYISDEEHVDALRISGTLEVACKRIELAG